MTHLTMEQLLGLREPASDPGSAAARTHLDSCEACRQELDLLHQRAAQLKALPTLRPPRDRWPAIRTQLLAERRGLCLRRGVLGGLALAASIALFLVWTGTRESAAVPDHADAIATAKAQSQVLEQALVRYGPEARVTDGRTATVVAGLEDQIAELDRQLQMAELVERAARQETLLNLWRERVGLMDALVDVHLTRATNVGL